MDKKKLYRIACHQGGVIRNMVIKRAHGRTPHYKDYPAIVVACAEKGTELCEVDTSRSCQNYRYEAIILNKLTKIGTLGGKSLIKGCKNKVGHCAEPHAANKLIRRRNKLTIAELEFSEAIRPRTLEVKSYCDNCKATFPQLK